MKIPAVLPVPTPEQALEMLVADGTLPPNVDPEGATIKACVFARIQRVVEYNQVVRKCQALAENLPETQEKDAREQDLERRLAETEQVIAAIRDIDGHDVLELVDENRRMSASIDQALTKWRDAHGENLTVRYSCCEWCGLKWLKLDGATPEDVRLVAMRHARDCKTNPLAVELRALHKAVDAAIEKAAEYVATISKFEGYVEVLKREVETWKADYNKVRSENKNICEGAAAEREVHKEILVENVALKQRLENIASSNEDRRYW